MIARLPRVGWSLYDDSGTIGFSRIAIRADSTVVQGFAAADGYRSVAAPLTGAAFVEQRVVYSYVAPDRAAPAPGIPIGDVAMFVFGTADPDQYGLVEVVGFRRTCLEASGPRAGVGVDLAATEIKAFTDELVSGRWCNPFGFVLTDVRTAFLTVR